MKKRKTQKSAKKSASELSESKKKHQLQKREAQEFAMLMQQAKTQHELQSIVAKMQEFEAEKKEEQQAVSTLEKELSGDISEKEEVARRFNLERELGVEAVSYDSKSQTPGLDEKSIAPGGDLYKHDDMYKGDEYITNESQNTYSATQSIQEKFDTRVFKSEIDEMVEKTTNMYKRHT